MTISTPSVTQLTTFKDGARQLRCASGTFSSLIKKGDLDVVTIGARGRRVIQAQLEALIAKNTLRTGHLEESKAPRTFPRSDESTVGKGEFFSQSAGGRKA